MNKIILIMMWGCLVGIFTACEDEHPGYLFSSEAAYPGDSLVVLTPASQRQAIEEMRQTKDNFENTEEGRKLYQRKRELEKKLDEENVLLYGEDRESDYYDGQEQIVDDLSFDVNYDDEGYPIEDEAYWAWEAAKAVFDSISGIAWDIKYVYIKEVEKQIETNIGNIDSKIVLFQRRLDNNVAYTSSPLDKIKGTAPLIYSIAGVKVKGEGNADKFADYVSVMGSGRILITWDEDIPVGRYVISLYVENEGWKNLLPDMFTVIVK